MLIYLHRSENVREEPTGKQHTGNGFIRDCSGVRLTRINQLTGISGGDRKINSIDMKRVFVFQDFKSQKFWSVDVQGTDVVVNYGKLGTDGQTQVKNFASAAEAEKAAAKLIAEKTKKGYVETAEETAREMKPEAKRFALTYDEFEAGMTLLDKILKDKKLETYKQLTVGCWDFDCGDCGELVKGLIENKQRLQQLEGLFWGDIDSEECEISWIEQTDLGPLLDVLPNLKALKIKGTGGLSIGRKMRPNLTSLEIISGGMPTDVVEDIVHSGLPNLEKLVLYVGVNDYGFDDDLEIFRPFFSKENYPKLKYLGIVDAEGEDEIVDRFLESDILPQLEVMDISCGILTDEGAQKLLDQADKVGHLQLIDMHYHFLSKSMQHKLQQLPVKVDLSDPQKYDEDYMSPCITE